MRILKVFISAIFFFIVLTLYSEYIYLNGKKILLKREDNILISTSHSYSLPLLKKEKNRNYYILRKNTGQKKLKYSYFSYRYRLKKNENSSIYILNRLFIPAKDKKELKKVLNGIKYKIIKKYTLTTRKFFLIELSLPSSDKICEFANKLVEQKKIRWCHPDFIMPKQKKYLPDDPKYSNQWFLSSDIEGGIEADKAWDITKGNKDIIIAVIDDGIDTNHPDLKDKIVYGYDAIEGTDDPSHKSSDEGHGTCCAGIAAATTDNEIGIAGVSFSSYIMPIYLLSPSETVSDEVNAFLWVKEHKAFVISNSWGPADGFWNKDELPDALRESIHDLVINGRNGKGCVIFWAAGNGSERCDFDGYASNPEVIAVGATDYYGYRTNYSDYGETLDIMAPGGDFEHGLETTDRTGSPGYNDGSSSDEDSDPDYTNSFIGTSAATPVAAGVGALILSVAPQLPWFVVKSILQRTADKIDINSGLYDEHGFSPWYGYGKINAYKAVLLASEDDNIPPSSITNLKFKIIGYKAYLEWTAPGDDYFNGQAIYYQIKYSENPITPFNFDEAKDYYEVFLPAQSGSNELLELKGLEEKKTYYFAIKTYDNKGNVSNISNIVNGTIPSKGNEILIYNFSFDRFSNGWTGEKTWSRIKEIGVNNSYGWTDSPEGNYENNENSSLISPTFDFTDYQYVKLTFEEKHSFEIYGGYYWDYGYIEVSTDGGNKWYPPIYGVGGSQSSYAELSFYLPNADMKNNVKIRFRLYSDYSNTEDGWYIDNVKIYGIPFKNIAPIFENFSQTPEEVGPLDKPLIKVKIYSDDSISTAKIFLSVNDTEFKPYNMTLQDEENGIYTYIFRIPNYPLKTSIRYYFYFEDNSTKSKSLTYPLDAPEEYYSYVVKEVLPSLDISSYKLIEYTSSSSQIICTLPLDTKIYYGKSLIIGRAANEEEFCTYWSISLDDKTMYLNGKNIIQDNGFPIINTSFDHISLFDKDGNLLDMCYSVGDNIVSKCLKRKILNSDGTSSDSWDLIYYKDVKPGENDYSLNNTGLKIVKISDSEDYQYEYIELFLDRRFENSTFSKDWDIFF